MSSKNDMLRVESLKTGDRFAFLNAHSEGTPAPTMIVTRSAAVNLFANSCHFRYQPQKNPGSAANESAWQDDQSWNGTLGVLVHLVDRAPTEATSVIPSQPAEGSRKKK